MEHDSSVNEHLRKKMTARTVMNKEIKLLEVDIDKNNKRNR